MRLGIHVADADCLNLLGTADVASSAPPGTSIQLDVPLVSTETTTDQARSALLAWATPHAPEGRKMVIGKLLGDLDGDGEDEHFAWRVVCFQTAPIVTGGDVARAKVSKNASGKSELTLLLNDAAKTRLEDLRPDLLDTIFVMNGDAHVATATMGSLVMGGAVTFTMATFPKRIAAGPVVEEP